MRSAKVLSFISAAALLLPALAFAKEQGKGKLQLTDPVQIGSTQLKPGDYSVEWNGSGPTVSVNFMKNDKTVATAPGKIIDLKKPARTDAVVLKSTANGKAKTIDQIQFAKHIQALQIEPTMLTKSTSPPKR